jgi:hypothetical protein
VSGKAEMAGWWVGKRKRGWRRTLPTSELIRVIDNMDVGLSVANIRFTNVKYKYFKLKHEK